MDHDGLPIRVTAFGAFTKRTMTPSFWNTYFDAESYVGGHLNFTSYFLNDYTMAIQMGFMHMSNLVETHMLRNLMIERLMFDAQSQSTRSFVDLKTKLNTTKETLT